MSIRGAGMTGDMLYCTAPSLPQSRDVY